MATTLSQEFADALASVGRRLAAEADLRWLVGGSAALILHGVELPAAPRDLDLRSDAAGATRMVALLTAAGPEGPLCQPFPSLQTDVPGQLSFDRTRLLCGRVEIDVVSNAGVTGGPQGVVHLSFDAAWRLRRSIVVGGAPVAVAPLEEVLVVELLRGRQERARLIAAHLHQRGFDWEAFAAYLEAAPGLEATLWETLHAVIPVARRAARRRAVRHRIEEEIAYFKQARKPPHE